MEITIEAVKHQVKECIEQLNRGELTAESLNRILENLDQLSNKTQSLLYLQASGTSLNSGLIGMTLVQDGKIIEPEADKWPYSTVMAAIQDGWRIIKFPELALLLDESRTYGLGCEFILEK